MRKGIKSLFWVCILFLGVVFILETDAAETTTAVHQIDVADEADTTESSDTMEVVESISYEECVAPFSYLIEDQEIAEALEAIIRKRDEEFLAKLEEEALIAKIKRENELAMTSVTKDMEEFRKKEGQRLLDEEDEKNGDVAAYSFDTLRKQVQKKMANMGVQPVQSIQDVFASNTNKIPENYEHSYTFKITAYCPCAECNGPWAGGITSTGVIAQQGRTIAVDPRVIPYGSKVLIGGHEFIAEDCGGAIKGARIDLYLDSHARCNSWGVRYLTVSWDGGNQKVIEKLVK